MAKREMRTKEREDDRVDRIRGRISDFLQKRFAGSEA